MLACCTFFERDRHEHSLVAYKPVERQQQVGRRRKGFSKRPCASLYQGCCIVLPPVYNFDGTTCFVMFIHVQNDGLVGANSKIVEFAAILVQLSFIRNWHLS